MYMNRRSQVKRVCQDYISCLKAVVNITVHLRAVRFPVAAQLLFNRISEILKKCQLILQDVFLSLFLILLVWLHTNQRGLWIPLLRL